MAYFSNAMAFWEQGRGIYNDNPFAEVPPPSAPAPAPAIDAPPQSVTVPAPAASHPPEFLAQFRHDPFAAFDMGGLPHLAAEEGEDEQMEELFGAEVPADYEVDATAEAEPQPSADACLVDPNLQNAEASPEMDVDAPGEEEERQHIADPNFLWPEPQPHNAEVSSPDNESALDRAMDFLLFGDTDDEQIPSSDTGAKAQEKAAPKTASELTGMRLPSAPVQHAESKFAPSAEAAEAAEALDTPVQMPEPEHIENPHLDLEDMFADIPLPAVAPAPGVESPPPMTPKGSKAISAAARDDPATRAEADAFLANMDARENAPVPAAGNLFMPQNNMWHGQSMQPQMNGMFHPSPAGNMYMPQAYPNVMAAQGHMDQMVMNAQMQHPYAAWPNAFPPPQMSVPQHHGMYPQAQNLAQPGVQAGNPLNPNSGIQTGHLPVQSHPQLNGHIHSAGQPVMLNAPAQHQAPLFFCQAAPATAPNGVGFTNAQAPVLNTPSQMAPAAQAPAVNGMFQYKAAQSFRQAGSAPFVNGAMNGNAQAPVLNSPSQMAPTNQMMNGMGQHQAFQPSLQAAPAPVLNGAMNASAPMINGMAQFHQHDLPEKYRLFFQRPNSKPGHQLQAFCIGCKVQVMQFGVRCDNCREKYRAAAEHKTRWCISCRSSLEPGTNRIFCDAHHAMTFQYTPWEKEKFKAEGICNNCYKVDAEKGLVTCMECRTSRNDGYKTRIDKAKSKGLCTTGSCGNENPTPYSKCDDCREKENVKRRKRPSPGRDNEGRGKRARKA